MITAEEIVRIAPAAKPYAAQLIRQMAESGILANARRASMFLGQIHVESGGFATVTENLNYAVDSLIKGFGRHRISVEDAKKFGRVDAKVRQRTGWILNDQAAQPNPIANILYGGDFGLKQLGNTNPGDGWRFRGRGLKQLTGRSNYGRFSRAWLGDETLLSQPDRVADPDGAVASAVWFWTANGLNELADKGTVEEVTKRVNGGDKGLAERKRWTESYRDAMH